MAEIKRSPVVYTYGREGRDACWAALTNSWNELARLQNKRSSSVDELKAWARAQPEGTNVIDSTTRTTTTAEPETAVVAETAAVEMATTPPPMPMMRSPPKLERRVAGGSYHRRHSYDWDTPQGGHGADGFLPFDLDKSVLVRSSDRGHLADSCGNHDFWLKFGCDDDEPDPKQMSPPPSYADEYGSDRSRPSTPSSLPSAVAIEEEETMSAGEHEAMTAVALAIVDEPTVTAVAEDEPTITAVSEDEPTVTAMAEDKGATDDVSTLLPHHRTGGDEAHDDEQATCSQPWATERREAKIKEVDDTILSYSKSLLISVLVVVLIRIFF
ncbi:uncharacterized protein LOC112688651 [Sipha flava]|uniref:Uncharacterized protein LOC112688651 n=1 Tax=Sipha flava TaxID=143950 RepID=A0A8B8G467_9HEMI|nr:uncharacterized protein LOC112688651 [Sipha flava]XP_025417737.1 uncharacterized protein LOC112688651 [Sipha flava]